MLSPEIRRRSQQILLWFGFFNSVSFNLLTGNLISLYLLRLGAGNTLVGTVASFSFVSFFFMVLGKRLVARVGVIRLFAWAWLVRYAAVLPITTAPLFLLGARPGLAYLVVVIGAFGFQAARGVGIIANAPMFSGYAGTADRGRLLSQFQIIAATVMIAVGTGVAFLLGPDAALSRYVSFILAGIVSGFIATGLVFSLPELEHERDTARVPIAETIRDALSTPTFRSFVRAFLLIAVAAGVGRSFLVVYAKQAYQLSDQVVFLLVAVGAAGNVLAGVLGSVLLDRLGAKPLILFALLAFFLSVLPILWTPNISGVALFVLLSLVFFLATLGFSGAENASQAYFFGVTHRDSRLNLGVLYFVTLGLGGVVGSFSGGLLLDLLSALLPTPWVFRVFFAGLGLVLTVATYRALRLEPLGAETFRGALEVIFSPRDLRAASLVNRLTRSRSQDEERSTIRSLAHSGSLLPVGEVLSRVEAPGYALRLEALDALEQLPFSPAVEAVLRRHLHEGEHTTAERAAWLLGLKGSTNARSDLWAVSDSPDRILAGRALVALARLKDTKVAEAAMQRIARALGQSPVVFGDILPAAVALQIAGTERSRGVLLQCLSEETLPDYVLDEVVFALSRIDGSYEWLYPFYSAFTRDDSSQDRLWSQYSKLESDSLQQAIRAIDESRDPETALSLLKREATIPPHLHDALLQAPARARIAFFLVASVVHATVSE